MKLTMALLLLIVVIAGVSRAQKDRAVGQAGDAATQAVIDVENKWVDALVKSDMTALDSIFADSYVDTDEHSHRGGKEDVLSFLKSGDLKLESIKLSDMQVHIYGDAAVAIGSSAQRGTFLGLPLASNIIFTDTLIKQNGKWKAIASHRSVAP